MEKATERHAGDSRSQLSVRLAGRGNRTPQGGLVQLTLTLLCPRAIRAEQMYDMATTVTPTASGRTHTAAGQTITGLAPESCPGCAFYGCACAPARTLHAFSDPVSDRKRAA